MLYILYQRKYINIMCKSQLVTSILSDFSWKRGSGHLCITFLKGFPTTDHCKLASNTFYHHFKASTVPTSDEWLTDMPLTFSSVFSSMIFIFKK